MNNSGQHVEIWNQCLDMFKKNITPQAFKTWFLPIKPVKFLNNVLTIQVPNKFFFEWLEEHYVEILKAAITKEIGPSARLEYNILVDQQNHSLLKNQTNHAGEETAAAVQVMNPFVIPGLK